MLVPLAPACGGGGPVGGRRDPGQGQDLEQVDRGLATALVEGLADAVRSEFEQVVCLEAPEVVEVPRGRLRAGGRSIHQRRGGVRCARTQLAMEEQVRAVVCADSAPRLTRAEAARAWRGASARWQDARKTRKTSARTGLREDQAATALSVTLTGTDPAAWLR